MAVTYALPFVFANFGIAIAARMPMMTTTISSSISVKPLRFIILLLGGMETTQPALAGLLQGNAETAIRKRPKSIPFNDLRRGGPASHTQIVGLCANYSQITGRMPQTENRARLESLARFGAAGTEGVTARRPVRLHPPCPRPGCPC